MARRLIFVESNTTGTGMLALTTAARLGFEPVLLTGDPGRYRGLADTGAEVVPCDTNDFSALAGAVSGPVAGVTTTSEFYLLAAARLAERLGLPGNPPAAIWRCRDKARLRERLAEAGIGQPRFAAVTDAGADVAAIGLPCVVKPVDESGSQNVLLCRSWPQVRAQLGRILAARVNARDQPAAGVALVEEYLDAPEYSVEMFSSAGVATCVGITAKEVTGDPYFVESGHLYPAPLDAGTSARIVDTVRSALAAVGVREGPTHTEVKLAGDRVAVVEINVRLAGGMIPALVRIVDGIDLIEQLVRSAAGLPVDLTARSGQDSRAGIRFVMADRSGTVTAVSGVDTARTLPGVRDVLVSAVPGARVAPARDAYGRLGHVIACGPTPEAVGETLDHALAAVRVSVAEEQSA
ncbi:ATP-grasp domain-containing protein [Actinophytocola oryzae]|uniref:Biotin carboxylase n=1 Tax=Actinophytocola oryzae TaxID=502181 RepID=A0A4R7V1L8_9PSEU|nr:ATP-grasp domain-containing protein [Actinophytocola oryzae]TDV43159.1 biotin carboxylase [Actinophytocola oryzae]